MKTTRKLWIALLMVIGVSLLVYGTAATVTKTFSTENKVTTGEVAIALIQNDGQGLKDQTVLPGETIADKIAVQNTGTTKSWVRIAVRNDDLEYYFQEFAVSEEDWEIVEGGEGDPYRYYYYKNPIDKGDAPVVLFDQIKISTRLTKDDSGTPFTLAMVGQAVQSAHNGETVLNATGWPEIPETEEVA